MDDRSIGSLVGLCVLAGFGYLAWLWVQDRGGVFADYTEENAAFAADFFEDLFPYSAVLATQKWHPRGAEAWDCTFAVVALSDDAPERPGARASDELGWQYKWGGDWQPTPAPELRDANRDAVAFCSSRLPEGLGLKLQTALQSEGSLFVRDGVGETVHIYAPSHGLAARIRFGD